jgi:hypothetical protein
MLESLVHEYANHREEDTENIVDHYYKNRFFLTLKYYNKVF